MFDIPYSPSRLDATKYFLNYLPKYLKRCKSIIDIGSGKLYFFDIIEFLNYKGDYFAIDIDPKMPIKSGSQIKVNIYKKSILGFKAKKKFDMAACLWVLEHIKDDSLAVKRICDIVKPKGILIIAVPSIWSWPFELGRHGYHYYSKSHLKKIIKNQGFVQIDQHGSGGLAGFVFMIIYSWPRLITLVLLLIFYQTFKSLKLVDKNWKTFSSNFVRQTFYKYHNYKKAVAIHNFIVDKISKIDNYLKLLPATYILVLKKK